MKALITGASSGLGNEFAKILSEMGYDIIAVARRAERLDRLQKTLNTEVTPIICDLSSQENCFALFEKVKNENIEIVINNAGFGLLGEFAHTDIERELEMIKVNVFAPQILTKLFLKKFISKNSGYILNVCSVGGYMPGPYISTYYATKAYLLSLTRAVCEEVRRSGKNIYVGCVCPGPVDTEFNKSAGGTAKIKSRTSEEIASIALKKMFKRKKVIIPGFEVKLSALAARIVPTSIMLGITYKIQKKKTEVKKNN